MGFSSGSLLAWLWCGADCTSEPGLGVPLGPAVPMGPSEGERGVLQGPAGPGQCYKGLSYASAVAGGTRGLAVTSWNDTVGVNVPSTLGGPEQHWSSACHPTHPIKPPSLTCSLEWEVRMGFQCLDPSSKAHGCWSFQMPAAWLGGVTTGLAVNMVLSGVTAHGKVGVSSPLGP